MAGSNKVWIPVCSGLIVAEFVRNQTYNDTPAVIRVSVKLFELGVRTPGGLFLAYGTPGVLIFGVFVH